MAWNITSDRPVYVQLMEQVKMMIISGEYAPGSRLPAVRDLAAEAAVNPNTMQKALSQLEQEELVFSQRTAGRFITEDTNKINEIKNSFAVFQAKEFLQTMAAMGIEKQEVLRYLEKAIEEEV